MDELAALAGRDPLQYRLDMAKEPAKRVIKAVAEMSGWNTKSAAGTALGMALHKLFDSYICVVAEVEMDRARDFAIRRVYAAADCGLTINPAIAREQITGGIVMGLSSALIEQLSIRGRQPAETNFDSYPVLRLSEMPRIEVSLVEGSDRPSGPSELGVPPVAPAVSNALFRLDGIRRRNLPLRSVGSVPRL